MWADAAESLAAGSWATSVAMHASQLFCNPFYSSSLKIIFIWSIYSDCTQIKEVHAFSPRDEGAVEHCHGEKRQQFF